MTDWSRLLAEYVRNGKLMEPSRFTHFIAKQYGVPPHQADGRVNEMKKDGAIVIANDGRIDRVYVRIPEHKVAELDEKWSGFKEQVKAFEPPERA